MDCRRFVPSAEGLEGRALLASLFGSSTSNANATQNIPETFALKEARIERLPHFMELFRSGRYLPPDTIAQLKIDLLAIAAKLHAPGPVVLNRFNSLLREVEPSSSLSVADARGLNQSFGAVVTAAGATPQQVQNLKNDMNELARVDANSPQPVFLATNDYTIVLETILAVGRPIRRPTVPQLAAHNGVRVNTNVGVTTQRQPLLDGTYDAGATMQIVDANGNIYGAALVKQNGPTESNGVANATGKYEITIDRPLANGLYTFYVRATDAEGNMSHNSEPFKLKVISRPGTHTATEQLLPPGGPLNLKQ
jgi:Big-like domain-containing protein